MHIKRMHNAIEKLTECFESELNKGTENVSAEEMEKVAKTICSLADAEYKSRVSKAMEESEEEEKLMQKIGMGEEERRYYRGQPRNEMGQYKEDGRRNRRSYNRHIDPEMYSADMYGFMPEEMKRIPMFYDSGMNNTTKVDNGNEARVQYSNGYNMGYSDGESNGYRRGYSDGSGGDNQRSTTEGRSGMARRRYYEEKEKHSANTTNDKEMKLKELEKYMAELASDITEMLSEETQEGRQMIKNKLTTLANKI